MRTLHIFTFLLFAASASAQQAPIFSQFFYQKNTSNPAAAGSQGHPILTAFNRQQWAGLEGAPSTQALSFSAAAFGKRVGLGLTLMNDHIGFFNTTFVNAAYAYRMKFGEGTLSVGMQGSLLHQRTDWAEARTTGFHADPNATGDASVPTFNVGAGAYFEHERFFAGMSVPQLLEKGFTQKREGIATDGTGWVRHFFAHAGTILDISPKVKIRPALATRIVAGVPPGFDAHLSFGLFPKETEVRKWARLWLGGTWRWSQSEVAAIGDALVFSGQYQVSEKLMMGFAYDFSMSEVQEQSAGTYELMLQYEFRKDEQGVRNPRYFE